MVDDWVGEDGAPSEFDRATAVRRRFRGAGSGGDTAIFDVDIDGGWTVGPKANGGYLLGLAGRAAGVTALKAGAAHADPLAASAHYLRAPEAGPAEVAVDVLRLGRGASQVRTVLSQGDKACVAATFTLGTLADQAVDPWWCGLDPLQLPPIDECIHVPGEREGAPFTVSVLDRCDVRIDPANMGFAVGRPGGSGEIRGWATFADGAPIDPLALLFFVDAFPPATFELAATGWVPTLSLTAYVRARPVPGPLRISQRAQVVGDDRVDEVCEVWDGADRLVAQATQLAGIRIEAATDTPVRR